jgi:predicted nucleic acid-binding protein
VEALNEDDVFVSVISIGEILKGISLLRESPRRRTLELWLKTLERNYTDRILSIDLETCRLWGELTAAAQKAGRVVHATDGLIAATALHHGLRVMTRNTADFEPTGVVVLNPWQQ